MVTSENKVVHLSNRARIVVVADEACHIHPLRQLRGYLRQRSLEIIEPAALPSRAVGADLIVWLADSPGQIPQEFGALADPSLAKDAFILLTGTLHGCPALLAVGGGLPGLIHAVNELGLRQLVNHGDVIERPALDMRQSPALPYRLLWSWDHSTNWYLHQLAASSDQFIQPHLGFGSSGPDCRLHRRPKPSNDPGINLIGFGQDIFGSGKGPHPARVDQRHRHPTSH